MLDNTNIDYFEGMIPCGIFEYGVTSLQSFIKKELKIKDIANIYPKYFLNHLNKEIA